MGIIIFQFKTDGYENMKYILGMIGIVAISFIILVRIPDEENDEN